MSLPSNGKIKSNFVKIKKDTALEVERKFLENLFENFLYVAGPARSGTNIISRAININSSYFNIRKMKQFEYWEKTTSIDCILEKMFRIPFDMLYKKIESDYVDDIKVRMSVAYQNRDFRKMLACKAASQFIHGSDMIDSENYTFWTMKANDYLGLKLFKDSLKKTKVVFIIRNPHSTIMSQTIRMGRRKGLKDNNRFLLDIIRASRYWCHFSRSIIDFIRNYPEDTILIRYEDFVDNPEFEMNRVFNFTDSMKIDKMNLDLSLIT